MEPDLPGGVVPALEEVEAEEEEVEVEWEVLVLGPDPAVIVYALIATPGCPIK